MLSSTEEIKQRLNIVDLIQEYVKLTPAGANFKAKCPFHNEKTPSFYVSSEKQIWHCFGCGLGGDHFEFVKRMENLEFPEALRILAAKANVKLDYKNPEFQSRRTKLIDLCYEIALFWQKKLINDSVAESVRNYLIQRRVSKLAQEEFTLGYAADSWDEAIRHLQNKGYSLLEISQAGISVTGDKGRPYDRFRNRLIFPIKDANGNIVGFGARKMKEEDPGGKYINSPQTDIYNKSDILYNLYQAKSEIKRLDYAILVEGYMDVLACHQAGTKNIVAVSGTALTEGQIKIIKRYTNNIMIAFDADAAGTLANLRGIDLAWQAGCNVKVIHLVGGKDPDEIIKSDKDKWREQVLKAENFMDYIFDITFQSLDLTRIDHKKKAAQRLLKVIGKLGDEVEKAHYLKKLAKELDISQESLMRALERIPVSNQTADSQTADVSPFLKTLNQEQILSERLMSLLFKFPGQIPLVSQQLEPEIIVDEWYQEVYKKLIIYYNKNQSFDSTQFVKEFSEEKGGFLNKVMLLAEKDAVADNPVVIKQEFVQLLNRLKKNHFNKQLRHLSQQIAQAEKAKDEELIKKLSSDFSKIMSQLATI